MSDRAERAPRPGQGTVLGDLNYTARNAIGQYYTMLQAGASPEELAPFKAVVIAVCTKMVASAQAL